jgi:hypothetical protein
MSNTENPFLKLFAQVKQIFKQTSLLLLTADEQMKKANWKSESKYATEGYSYSIDNPAQWLTSVAFRFYKHRNYPHHLVYISVLFDGDHEGYYTIQEPYVTAGILDFGNAEASLKGDYADYWYSRYFGYLLKDDKAKPDGKVYDFENEKLDKDIGRFKSAKVFGVPLVSISNATDVESQITNKLLNLLKKPNIGTLN